MKQLVIEKAGENAYDFFSRFVNIESKNTLVVSTTNEFNILNNNDFNCVINLSKVNNIRYYFLKVDFVQELIYYNH